MEEWKSCIEDYEISNTGNIRRKLLKGGYKDVKGSINNRGYKYFQLMREGKRLNYLIHHLVAQHFISERPEDLVIDHIDRNKLNNCVNNLRYITQKENMHNWDRVVSSIPFDEPDRHKKVCKKYREEHKDEISTRKKERVICEKCGYSVCRAYLTAHSRKCDGTYIRSRSGRKKSSVDG